MSVCIGVYRQFSGRYLQSHAAQDLYLGARFNGLADDSILGISGGDLLNNGNKPGCANQVFRFLQFQPLYIRDLPFQLHLSLSHIQGHCRVGF